MKLFSFKISDVNDIPLCILGVLVVTSSVDEELSVTADRGMSRNAGMGRARVHSGSGSGSGIMGWERRGNTWSEMLGGGDNIIPNTEVSCDMIG